MHECLGEPYGVAALLAVHAAPGGDYLPGLLGIIGYDRLGISRGALLSSSVRKKPGSTW
jgi:hypothetical protein